MKTNSLLKLATLLFPLLSTTITHAQIDPIDKSGLAIGGYDLVAYFKLNQAVKGDPAIKSIYNNTTYLFSKEDHKRIFDSNPQHYLPQYEGYCALAVGTTAKKISLFRKRLRSQTTNYTCFSMPALSVAINSIHLSLG